MLKRLDEPITIDYGDCGIIKTNIVAILIDYGKSTIVKDGTYYSFTNKYHTDTIQDCLSILITSLALIHTKYLWYMSKLLLFVERTAYACGKTFKSPRDIKTFLYNKKKYDNVMMSDKGELQQKNCIDFVQHVLSHYKTNMIVKMPKDIRIKNRYTLSEDDVYKRLVKKYKVMNSWEKASYNTCVGILAETNHFCS
jgi:hypothetical protein